MILKTRVRKDCGDISSYINKPVKNGLNQVVGTITDAKELADCIELTMDVKEPESLIKPVTKSFSINSRSREDY